MDRLTILLSSWVLLTIGIVDLGQGAAPSVLKICSRDDPELNACLKDAIQSALQDLAGGFNESGVVFPPLDPHYQKEIKLEYKQNQIYGKATLRNLRTYGLSRAKVLAVRANLLDDLMEMEVDMSSDETFVEGYTKVEGRFNAIVLKGAKGPFNQTMKDLKWTWRIAAVPEIRNGKTYMVVSKFFMRPEIGDMDMNLPTIFEDNPRLNEMALSFAKVYWKPIYHELLPIIEKTWSATGTKVTNKIFKNIPYDEIFPPM